MDLGSEVWGLGSRACSETVPLGLPQAYQDSGLGSRVQGLEP